MLHPLLQKNDTKAYWLIGIFSVVVFAVVVLLGRIQLQLETGFDVHIFAKLNAILNATVAVLLVAALISVKAKNYKQHRNLMIAAMLLSLLFLLSYIAHHLLSGDARFGDVNHDGLLSESEKTAVGFTRYIYLLILLTHITLATFILPIILFTAYRGLTGEWEKHKKLARYTWPLWLYVAITGPVVYIMISPYYS